MVNIAYCFFDGWGAWYSGKGGFQFGIAQPTGFPPITTLVKDAFFEPELPEFITLRIVLNGLMQGLLNLVGAYGFPMASPAFDVWSYLKECSISLVHMDFQWQAQLLMFGAQSL